ncbi:MAG: hypothetical protein P8X96_19205 [Desulfobacteraceae bacterium]
MCSDPFMELGMTLRPKHLECFKHKIATHSLKVIILFENRMDALKWNIMHEKLIRTNGHMATIGLSTLVYLLGGGAVRTIATGSASAILKDEVQAGIWYPKMFEGWVLTRNYTFRYEQFPGQDFYMSWNDVIQDETGAEMERRKHGQSHFKVDRFFGIPENVVRNIMTRFPLKTIKFK